MELLWCCWRYDNIITIFRAIFVCLWSANQNWAQDVLIAEKLYPRIGHLRRRKRLAAMNTFWTESAMTQKQIVDYKSNEERNGDDFPYILYEFTLYVQPLGNNHFYSSSYSIWNNFYSQLQILLNFSAADGYPIEKCLVTRKYSVVPRCMYSWLRSTAQPHKYIVLCNDAAESS